MKLNNLPKDMLVKLVSELQDRKEKEYSEYVVIYREGSDIPAVWHFDSEHELKSWILFELLDYSREIFSDNENILLFLEEWRKLPRDREDCHVDYCKNKSSSFQSNELLSMLNKIDSDFVMIKGKCVSGNTNKIQGF